MKSLLDIQKDIINLENTMVGISSDIRQISDDIDEMRNQNKNMDLDFDEIKKMSRLIQFKKHPIGRIEELGNVELYLETLINIIKFDEKNPDEKIDARLVFIQWLLDNSKADISLEDLISNSLRAKASDFDAIATGFSKRLKELLVVDLLIVANMNGTFNGNECDYVADILAILGVDREKLKALIVIAKMVLCQKMFETDRELNNALLKELGNYRHYFIEGFGDDKGRMTDDISKEIIKSMRIIAVDIPFDDATNFKWKCKNEGKVSVGAVLATYQKRKKQRGYSFSMEFITKNITSPCDGTIFQFRDNNVIYGVVSHESDDRDSIKQWVRSLKQ